MLAFGGIASFWAGEYDDAERYLLRAVRLNPNDYSGQWILTRLAHLRIYQGRFEEALDWASRAYAVAPGNPITHTMLVAANAHLGRLPEAGRWVEVLRRSSPETTFARIRLGYQMMRDPRQVEVVIDGLRLAGMPDDEAIRG